MLDRPAGDTGRSRLGGIPILSPRESQVLRLLAEGRSTAQIAATMSISSNTARARIHHLRAKLEVDDRQQVLPRARSLGLV
jgi:DNA-binding CsgD family transcriptional regulator